MSTDVWLFSGTAGPAGVVSVFNWTVPKNTSQGPDEYGYFELQFETRLFGDEESILEWGYFIFDRFETEEYKGLWRPAKHYFVPPTNDYSGTPVMTKQSFPGVTFDDEDVIFNRTSFDGEEFRIVLLARAETEVPVTLAIRPYPHADDFTENATILRRMQGAPDLVGAVAPWRTRSGFELTWYVQGHFRQDNFMRYTQNVEVRRETMSNLVDRLAISARHSGTEGHTFAVASFGGAKHVSSFSLDASYRGRNLSAASNTVQSQLPGGSLRAQTHLVYRDGPGGSAFRLELDYAQASTADTLSFYKVDFETPLRELLGHPIYEHWRVRGVD